MKTQARTPWLFLSPHLPLFSIFILLPLLAVFAVSFFDWNLLGDHRFIGLSNYSELATDHQFWRALQNTVVYGLVIVPATMAAGLALALALNRPVAGRQVFRAAIYLPTVLSSVASAIIAACIFDDQYGVLNAAFAHIGLARLPWLSSTTFAMPAIMFTTVWLRTGLCMVIYLAALQEIPRELTEAAHLDGAGAWNRFRWVTWPLLRPSTIFLLITNIIYSFNVFDLVFVMTGGGPAFSTDVLAEYVYEAAFDQQRQGYAAAIGVILFLIVLIPTMFLLLSRRKVQKT